MTALFFLIFHLKKESSKAKKAKSAKQKPTKTVEAPSPKQLEAFQRAQKRSRELAKKQRQAKVNKKDKFLASPTRRGKKYNLDLRIHSPATDSYFSGGGVQSVDALVRLAKTKGLHCIAVTDFYNVENIDAVKASSAKTSVNVVPGFDIRCKVGACEEVFLITLFPEESTAEQLRKVLAKLGVSGSDYGSPELVLKQDFSEVLSVIETAGGVTIPSHIDKTPYRQLAVPALIEEYGFHAFDLIHVDNTEFFKEEWPGGEFTFFSFSNANSLAQIGSRVTNIKLPRPGFEGIKEIVQRRSK